MHSSLLPSEKNSSVFPPWSQFIGERALILESERNGLRLPVDLWASCLNTLSLRLLRVLPKPWRLLI